MATNPLAIARACLQAYVDKDQAAIEALLHEDFHFTSPIDNAIDRATYLKICWPNCVRFGRFDAVFELEKGDRACIVYEAQTTTGKRFRNCEVYVVRDGQLLATEVYFGWDIPHEVPHGTHVDRVES